MNKVSIVSLVACALVAPSAMAGHFDNTNGKVFFTGKVFSNSCRIHHGDREKTITLPSVINNAVNDKDAVKVQAFSIKVDNCYVNDKYKIRPKLYWTNVGDFSTEGYMLNNLKNGASNAALMLMDRNSAPINLNKSGAFEAESYSRDNDDDDDDDNNKSLTYNFKVGYIKPSTVGEGFVTPGRIQTQVNYTINYM